MPMGVDLTEKYLKMSKDLMAKGQLFSPNYLFLTYEIHNFDHLVMQGGARSTKTYSTIQWMWKQLEDAAGVKYSVVRQSSPTLKATVLKDFQDIGFESLLYKPSQHNLTENVYQHKGNIVDFFACEEEEKVRGRKRHVLYCNEAPELRWDVVEQLLIRTTSKKIYDFNPSYPDSWVYDNIMSRKNCAYIITTFHDNPFMTPEQLDEMEWMRINDPEQFRIFGLGQRGEMVGQIYSGWTEVEDYEFPADANVYVVDFGYSVDPTSINQFKFDERAMWVKERLYQTQLDNVAIAIHLYFLGYRPNRHHLIVDSAEPKSIGELRYGWDFKPSYVEELVAGLGLTLKDTDELNDLCIYLRDGLDVVGATKGSDSIRNGIQRVRQYDVYVTKSSTNIWKEYHKYKWKTDMTTGKIIQTPDKSCPDHALDTIRYAATSHGRIY